MNKKTQAVMFSSTKANWPTPRDLFERLDATYSYDIDVCATKRNAKRWPFISPRMNAFVTPWTTSLTSGGTPANCFMNPPYSKGEKRCVRNCKKKRCRERGTHCRRDVPSLYDWVHLAYRRSQRGCLVTCLLPARTDTAWFHEFIWNQEAHAWRDGVQGEFLAGRLTFGRADSGAPFPSLIATFLPSSCSA